MLIAVAFASVALLLGTSASSADPGLPVQIPRPQVVPPMPRSQPPPVLSLPFPTCDRIPQPPRYPALALAMGEQGAVTLRIFVLVTGTISETLAFQSSGSARLDEAAVASTRSWMLMPGRQGSHRVSMWTEAIVSFRIFSGEPSSAKVEVQFPMAADINRCLA